MSGRQFVVVAGVMLLGAVTWVACGPAGASGTAGASKQEGKVVKVSVYNRDGKLVPVETPKVVKTDAEWKAQLTPAQYEISRDKGTERPFCGNLLDNHLKGVYTCVSCGLPVFSSESKFESGTGWPSFFQPVAPGNVLKITDDSHGMIRTEILCGRCDGHLGHVFEDGPPPTGLRFCVNSESLLFTAADKLATLADPAAGDAPATKPATRPAQ